MSMEVGQILEGKVTGITNFGAFIGFDDNQSGLVHISEVSNGFVKDINDILSVGDTVKVKVLKVSPDGKVNLSIRQASATAEKTEQRHESREYHDKDAGPKRQEYSKRSAPKFQKQESKPFSSSNHKTDDFDSMMSQFLKDSEDRLTSLKRSTEGKRGGRGGRRG